MATEHPGPLACLKKLALNQFGTFPGAFVHGKHKAMIFVILMYASLQFLHKYRFRGLSLSLFRLFRVLLSTLRKGDPDFEFGW